MYIAYQHDKRSGITYAYEVTSFRDPETKRPKSKRTLIGRVDPETKEIIKTDGRCRHRSPNADSNPPQNECQEAMPRTISELKAEVLRLRAENRELRKQIGSLTQAGE